MEAPIFISEEQREELRTVVRSIEKVVDAITIDHEEHTALKSALDSLDTAIKKEQRYRNNGNQW